MRGLGELLRAEHAFEQNNRSAHAGAAQYDALLETGHRESIGIRQRDVFLRTFEPDGTMLDTSVDGFNKGGSLHFTFRREARGALEGTEVAITIRLPLPPVVGPLIRPLLEAHVRRELRAAAAEDKRDIELGGYPRAAARPSGMRATASM
jgi:hypothetical protein